MALNNYNTPNNSQVPPGYVEVQKAPTTGASYIDPNTGKIYAPFNQAQQANARTPGLSLNPPASGPSNPLSPSSYGASAADNLANIAGQDWERYQKTFIPLEDYLTGMINNPQYNHDQIVQNLSAYNKQFDASAGTTGRSLGRMGLTMTQDQNAALQNYRNLQKSLGQVEAVNRTARGLRDTEYSIIGSGAQPYRTTQQTAGLGLTA